MSRNIMQRFSLNTIVSTISKILLKMHIHWSFIWKFNKKKILIKRVIILLFIIRNVCSQKIFFATFAISAGNDEKRRDYSNSNDRSWKDIICYIVSNGDQALLYDASRESITSLNLRATTLKWRFPLLVILNFMVHVDSLYRRDKRIIVSRPLQKLRFIILSNWYY